MTVVEKHPQRQEIINWILAGETLRSIAKRVVPPLNHVSLSRFKLNLVQPAIRSMRGTNAKYQVTRDIAESVAHRPQPGNGNDAVRNALSAEVEQRFRHALKRRETWISAAEKVPVTDAEGNVTGYTLDHKALAAHDLNEQRALRAVGELGGLFQQTGPAVQVNAVIVLPGPQEQFRQVEQREAIDIAVVEVEQAK
jgi:hypothetical protein